MSDDPLIRERDYDRPGPDSTLGHWRIFAYHIHGPGTPAWDYLDELCRQFGPDWVIHLDPEQWWDHVLHVDHDRAHEAWLKEREAA